MHFLDPLLLYIQGLRSRERNAESAKNCSDTCGCLEKLAYNYEAILSAGKLTT